MDLIGLFNWRRADKIPLVGQPPRLDQVVGNGRIYAAEPFTRFGDQWRVESIKSSCVKSNGKLKIIYFFTFSRGSSGVRVRIVVELTHACTRTIPCVLCNGPRGGRRHRRFIMYSTELAKHPVIIISCQRFFPVIDITDGIRRFPPCNCY